MFVFAINLALWKLSITFIDISEISFRRDTWNKDVKLFNGWTNLIIYLQVSTEILSVNQTRAYLFISDYGEAQRQD